MSLLIIGPSICYISHRQSLICSIESEEGKALVTTASRGEKDYDAVVKMLKQRYDRPRETCRIVLDHCIESTHEGLGRLLSMFTQTITAMQELTDNKVETLLSILMEMRLPQDPFKEWMKDTAKDSSPPSSERFVDFIERCRSTLTPGASQPTTPNVNGQPRVAACHVKPASSVGVLNMPFTSAAPSTTCQCQSGSRHSSG